jgi:hypothetical protein
MVGKDLPIRASGSEEARSREVEKALNRRAAKRAAGSGSINARLAARRLRASSPLHFLNA